jgi:hypothetical protein
MCKSFSPPEPLMLQFPTSSDLLPRAFGNGRFKAPIGISWIVNPTCESSMSSKTLKPRSPTPRDLSPRVPRAWMARILLGNRGLRFQYARVSCLRKPRFSDSRLFGIARHMSLLRSTTEILCRGFTPPKVSILLTCKTPMPPMDRIPSRDFRTFKVSDSYLMKTR